MFVTFHIVQHKHSSVFGRQRSNRDVHSFPTRRSSDLLSIAASRSGTCGVVQNSAAVSSGTLAFVAGDVGRTFRVSTSPYYTITAVALGVATLDRTYLEATDAAATGIVFDGYATLPADFARFYAIIHPSMRWRIRFALRADRLNRLDPMRQSATGTPRLLAN